MTQGSAALAISFVLWASACNKNSEVEEQAPCDQAGETPHLLSGMPAAGIYEELLRLASV